MAGFNENFDKEQGDALILELQQAVGCFYCHAPDPKSLCVTCRLSKYCGKKCQKKDWKKGDKDCPGDPHKELCRLYQLNLEEGFPVPLALKAIGYLNDDVLGHFMHERLILALEEIRRCFDASGKTERRGICLSLAVMPRQLGRPRLQGMITFYDHGKNRVQEVRMAVFYAVGDEDDDVGPVADFLRQRNYPSYHVRVNTLEALTNVVHLVQNSGLSFANLTLGRGLNWLYDKGFSESEEGIALKEANGGEKLSFGHNTGRKYIPLDDHLKLEQLNHAKKEMDSMFGEYDSEDECVEMFERAIFPESDRPEGFSSRSEWKARVNAMRAEFPEITTTTIMGCVEEAGPEDVDCEEARKQLARMEAESNEMIQKVMAKSSED